MTEEKGTGIKVPADFKARYLEEVSKLLELAYEERGIETRISGENISITLNIPRTDTEMDADTVDFLTQLHRINH